MNLVFFLEEPSAREMLKGLLPRLLSARVVPHFIVFEGKQDLERSIERRLRGWVRPDSAFVVVRDQDAGDCLEIKRSLMRKCADAGKPDALVRVACRELESWYFGDLAAVERGLGVSGLVRYGGNRKYRIPDQIHRPSSELAKITRQAYQKVAGSRAIGRELSLTANGSQSFHVLLSGLSSLVGRWRECVQTRT